MGISITKILRQSSKFSTIQIIAKIIQVPVSIIILNILSPSEYGIYGFLALWLTYAAYVNPGILGAGIREIPVLLGKGKDEEASVVQNAAISAHLLYLLAPFLVFIGASLYFSDTVLRIGFLFIAANFLLKNTSDIWATANYIRQKFNIVAKGSLVAAVGTPLITISTISWIGLYALLLSPTVMAAVLLVYYLRNGPINFKYALNKKETVRLLKVGVVLQLGNIAYWGYQLTDKTIIAAMLPIDQLGIYMSAMSFVTYGVLLIGDFVSVLQPIIWTEAGKKDTAVEGFRDAKRITIYLALVTSIAIPLLHVGFYVLVTLLIKRFTDAIPVFFILSSNLFLVSITTVPNLILSSSIVNKQKITTVSYSVGWALSIGLSIMMVYLGYGIIGVAFACLASQALIAAINFYFSKEYISHNSKDLAKFLTMVFLPFAITIMFYFIHVFMLFNLGGMLLFVGLSLALQAVTWLVAIKLIYKDYITMAKIMRVVQEFKGMLFGCFGKKRVA